VASAKLVVRRVRSAEQIRRASRLADHRRAQTLGALQVS
jgi:hypothetical protein